MRVPFSGSLVALLIIVGVFAAVAPEGVRAGSASFSPLVDVTLRDPTAGDSSGYEFELTIPEGDLYPFRIVHFLPSEWTVAPGDEIPHGALVARLDTEATLGLFSSACNQSLPIHFDLRNASTDSADVVLYGDGDDDGVQDIAEDEDSNGLDDAVDKYPDILVRMFPGMEPIRRAAGITIVAGVPTLIQFLIFEDGTQVPGSPHVGGYPVVTVVGNIGDPEILQAPYAITDYCSPQYSSVEFFGHAEGVPLYMNPAEPGAYTVHVEVTSLPDADGDGYENTLDTCPLIPNTGNPRIQLSGDLDADGLDIVCDPDDSTAAVDEDNDGYQNRQDNCPLTANGQAVGETNQADADHDYIGDVCDPNPNEPNGEFILAVRQPQVAVAGDAPILSGDVDCDGEVTTRDAQVIVRSVVGDGLDLPASCPDVGDPVG